MGFTPPPSLVNPGVYGISFGWSAGEGGGWVTSSETHRDWAINPATNASVVRIFLCFFEKREVLTEVQENVNKKSESRT